MSDTKKLDAHQEIADVGIELDAPDFAEVNSLEGVIKLEHFEHLEHKLKGPAQRELLDKLRQYRKENPAEDAPEEETGSTMTSITEE